MVFRKNGGVTLSLMARNRSGEWKWKQWFQSVQSIQLCSAIKLAFNTMIWWI